jgi:hypothetical protein
VTKFIRIMVMDLKWVCSEPKLDLSITTKCDQIQNNNCYGLEVGLLNIGVLPSVTRIVIITSINLVTTTVAVKLDLLVEQTNLSIFVL